MSQELAVGLEKFTDELVEVPGWGLVEEGRLQREPREGQLWTDSLGMSRPWPLLAYEDKTPTVSSIFFFSSTGWQIAASEDQSSSSGSTIITQPQFPHV